jgi:Fur family ferric uptake transcriptional regulator
MLKTRQREVILSVLREAGRPLTRTEILQLGREKIPRLGSSTVDRSIREFTEVYELLGVDFPGQPRRYELPTLKEHPHFICRLCDRVYDLDVHMKLPELEMPKGFVAMGGEVIYSGTCAKCNS